MYRASFSTRRTVYLKYLLITRLKVQLCLKYLHIIVPTSKTQIYSASVYNNVQTWCLKYLHSSNLHLWHVQMCARASVCVCLRDDSRMVNRVIRWTIVMNDNHSNRDSNMLSCFTLSFISTHAEHSSLRPNTHFAFVWGERAASSCRRFRCCGFIFSIVLLSVYFSCCCLCCCWCCTRSPTPISQGLSANRCWWQYRWSSINWIMSAIGWF